MASSWWPFWPFGKGSSSSPTNFLHLSRTNIERIRELIAHEEPLNPHQCRSMSSMLERTMRSIERIVDAVDDINVVCGSVALENFYRVSEKGKQLVENCCSGDWCQASAFQFQNEEAFKEIFLETSLCYNTIWTVVEGMNCHEEFLYEDLRETSTFDPSSADEVFKDRVSLQGRLKGLVNDANNSSCHIRSHYLGQYLLGRVNWALQHSNDEDFDVRSFNLWSDGNGPDEEWSEKSIFLGGNVCKTTWLDVPCAKKLFQDEMQEHEWLAEANILASLNHPNIVKFLCCNKYETEHTRGHFIAMEQMDMNLGSFIKRFQEGGAKLSLFLALDIILQIAYGMCYLHGNGIAHRDLKTSNVVVSRAGTPQLQYYLQVKVVDFGISKVKLSQDKSNTMTRPKIGTTLYMPPEAFSNGRANWFKADVYSFSVVCSVILSGSEPFQDIQRRDLGGAICRGRRPTLPEGIPKELALVITDGWCMDRNLRPTFVDICTRLEKLRHRLLRSHGSSELSLKQEKLDSNLYIEGMLKRRSEARANGRSAFHLTKDKPEWFDGGENATTAAGGFQAGPPHLQLLQQTPFHQQRVSLQQPTPTLQAQQPNGIMYAPGGYTGKGSSFFQPREKSGLDYAQAPAPLPQQLNQLQLATSSLSQSSSRTTQSAYESRNLPSITSSEARASSPYCPPAQLSSSTSAQSLLQLQALGVNPGSAFAGSPSGQGSSQSGRPREGFTSPEPFTSQSHNTHRPPQLHQPLDQNLESVVLQQNLQTMNRNIRGSMYSAQITRPTVNLQHENAHAEDQQAHHDPISHYEQYILRGPRSADFREPDQAGQASSSIRQSQIGSVVDYPSTTPNPPYIELSYEQIFDQPWE